MYALKPIAIEVENSRGGGGGGGRGPRQEDSLVDMLLKAWANSILESKISPLQRRIAGDNGPMELSEFALHHKLSQEFGRVADSSLAARRIIREHSAVPFVKFLI